MDEETPANLVMLYFEEPDVHGHVYGPEANEVLKILKKLDNITYYLDVRYLLLKKMYVFKCFCFSLN